MILSHKLLRKIFKIPPPKYDKEQIVELFRKICVSEGYKWEHLQPLAVREKLFYFEIMTNSDSKGGYMVIRMDCTSGEVLQKRIAPR